MKIKQLMSIFLIIWSLLIFSSCKKENGNIESVIDIDGNVYDTIHIGNQVWMKQNLNVTHYRNGDPIPNVTDSVEWGQLSSGAYCINNRISGNVGSYGKLYNWYTVGDTRNLAPTGWHIPSDEEWSTLTTYLGGELVAGGKLKEIGTSHWQSPNTNATNSTGFTALPGGRREFDGTFYKNGGDWSSSTDGSPNAAQNAWHRYLLPTNGYVTRSCDNKRSGFSVRCIKN